MRKKFLSLALCLLLALVIPAGVFAQGIEWDVSKSKTATNLDDNYEANVTLSLPSAEEQLVTDVVFVLDESSCSEPVKAQVAQMLDTLYQQIEKTGASIKIGAVQFRGEVTTLPLTELSDSTKDTVTEFMSQRPSVGGSNMSMGLLAGEAMLDADSSVSADRKYLILVSDGITYIWDDETTAAPENYGVNFANADAMQTPMLASPDGWDVKYGTCFVPDDWASALENISTLLDKTIADKASIYVRGEDLSGKPFVSYPEKDSYLSTVDIALYKSYQAYQRISQKYSHTYAVMTGVENEMALYPFGPSFMEYLAGGKVVSFEQIQNDILYLVDAGSRVEDTLGYVEGEYDFNLKGIDTFQLTVKGQALAATVDAANNHVYFGEKDAAGKYPYEVLYTPGEKDAEKFTLTFNVPVSNFAPVQLSYTVVLANPKTEAGTYGQYDANGSLGYDGLYTNNSAILYPKDTNGVEGPSEVFPMPTVSYTVKPVSSQPEESSSVPEESSSQSESQPENSSSEVSNTPAGSSSAAPSNSSTASNPKTGESNSMEVWVVLLAVAAACLTVSAMVTIRKKAK